MARVDCPDVGGRRFDSFNHYFCCAWRFAWRGNFLFACTTLVTSLGRRATCMASFPHALFLSKGGGRASFPAGCASLVGVKSSNSTSKEQNDFYFYLSINSLKRRGQEGGDLLKPLSWSRRLGLFRCPALLLLRLRWMAEVRGFCSKIAEQAGGCVDVWWLNLARSSF